MKLSKDGLGLLVDYFASFDDHRIDRTKKYDMMTIIFIIIFVLGCGSDPGLGSMISPSSIRIGSDVLSI